MKDTINIPNKSKDKKFVWVSLQCRRGKDLLSIQNFQKHEEVHDSFFFTEEGIATPNHEKAKNLWAGIIFIKIELIDGKMNKELRDFLFRNPLFGRFYTQKRDYISKPIYLSDREIKRILKRLQSVKTPTTGKFNPNDVDFKVNEFVTVLSGVFRGYEGEVIEIDYDTGVVTLSIEFFGRITPIQIGFTECKKIS